VYVAQKKCQNTTDRAAMPRNASNSDKRWTPDCVFWTANGMLGLAAADIVSFVDFGGHFQRISQNRQSTIFVPV
jgi:hypothetical protein